MRVSDISLLPRGDPDSIDPSYSSEKEYLVSLFPIGTLAEKRLTYTTKGGYLVSSLY
jgi:hypothetical protein